MALGLLILRVVLGGTLAAHGAQKVFGWFEGGGPQGTAGFFRGLAFRSPLVMAWAAGLSELLGGLGIAFGFLTPFAAVALVVVMIMAVATVHWRNGFWAGNGGFEFNLLIAGAAAALAGVGPGRWSIDSAAGWADNLSGTWWCVGVLVVGALAAAAMLTVGRYHPKAHPTYS
jgi:putative oxidoreductase